MAERNKAAQTLGARGGKARASNLTSKERSEAAKKAAIARWAGHVPSDKPSAKSKRKARHTRKEIL